MGVLKYSAILAGGHNGSIYSTRNEGASWMKYTVRPMDNTKTVDTYWAIDFIPEAGYETALRGAIGLKYTDGSYAVWQTGDGSNRREKWRMAEPTM